MGSVTLYEIDKDPGGVGPQMVKCPTCQKEFLFYAVYEVDRELEFVRQRVVDALEKSCPSHKQTVTW